MNLAVFAAAVDLPSTSVVAKLRASDLILIIGLATLLLGGLIIGVVFLRGPRRDPSERRNPPKSTPPVTITDDGRERHRKKRRMRRRDHRQRNPTLSQTGGLPPPRNPEQSPTI